ncbi:MAG: hypothetical protein QM811_02400 [Pirellulales bacterium]
MLNADPTVRISSQGVRAALNLGEGPLPTEQSASIAWKPSSVGVEANASSRSETFDAAPKVTTAPNAPLRLTTTRNEFAPQAAEKQVEPSAPQWKPIVLAAATAPIESEKVVSPKAEPTKITITETATPAVPVESTTLEKSDAPISPLRGVSRGNPLRGGK